jgi:hypothetical protein
MVAQCLVQNLEDVFQHCDIHTPEKRFIKLHQRELNVDCTAPEAGFEDLVPGVDERKEIFNR